MASRAGVRKKFHFILQARGKDCQCLNCQGFKYQINTTKKLNFTIVQEIKEIGEAKLIIFNCEPFSQPVDLKIDGAELPKIKF